MPLTTKRALATSLKNMLSKKTLDKITVTDIVDDCSLNRQTFYYHFHDAYALLEWMYLDEAKDIVDNIDDPVKQSGKFDLILNFIVKNKTLVLNTYRSLDPDFLMEKLKSFMLPVIVMVGKSIAPNADKEEIDFTAEMYTYALIGLSTDWAKKGLPEEYLPKFTKLGHMILNGMKALN